MFTILKGFEGYHFNNDKGEWEFLSEHDWRFAKKFTPYQENGLPAMLPSKFIVVDEYEPEDLEETWELTKLLTSSPNLLAIRAKLAENVPMPVKRNRKTFNTEVTSRIVAIDVDSIPAFSGFDYKDLEATGKYVVSLFNKVQPEVFSLNTGFIIHASSSSGIKHGVRAHMFFEANEEVSQAQLKYYFSNVNKYSREVLGFDLADLAFYSGTQPHYFADPIFEGVKDPFEGVTRSLYVKGDILEFPAHMPAYQSRKAEVTRSDSKFFDMVEGTKFMSERVEETFEDLCEAEDGVFLRLIPKLYHRAWQDGVCINWLEKQLVKPLSKYIASNDKGRQIQDYINNGRKEALRAFIGEARRSVPENLLGVKVEKLEANEESLYLEMKDLPPEGTITFVKASLGTGKTTAVTKWIDEGKVQGRFLAVTNTRSLVSSNAEKFRSGMYTKSMDLLNFSMGQLPRMSTTIHSLHKFKNLADKIDFLFIDESDAVMSDLLFSPLIKQRRECIQTLHDIILHAKHVILSDGDISEETIEAYGRLVDFSKPINAVVHDRKMLKDASAFEFPDEKSIWVALKACLELGESCILVSDCSPDEINSNAITLREQTGCIVKEVHSASTEDEDIRAILDKTNDELKAQRIDALLCSPSVTSGVDFNYFENIFVITRTNNHTPNLRFQAARRDRGARSIFYYTSKQAEGFHAGSSNYLVEEGWLEQSQQIYAKRREQESMHYCNTFRYYLMAQGCKIKIMPDSWGALDSSEESYTLQKINAILESTAQYAPPRHNDAYLLKEYIVKYFHLDSTTDVDFQLAKDFVTKKPHKKAEFFHKLYKNFWPSIKQCNNKNIYPFIDAIQRNKSLFFLDTGKNANPKFAKMYLSQAGIPEPGNFEEIIDFYRTYCRLEGIEIPEEFLNDQEKTDRLEGQLEL